MRCARLVIISLVLSASGSVGLAALSGVQCEAIRGKHTAYGRQLCERTLKDEQAGDLQFGLAGLWLNRETVTANERLRQGFAKVIQDDQMTPEVATRFKWAMRGWLRAYYLFYDQSAFFPGRLAADVQRRLEEMFWNYACAKSSVARAKPQHIWFIQGSENHDMMDLSNAFLALQAVYKLPEYQDRKLPDGHTAEEHRQAWSEYYRLYCDERAKGGLFVEISPTYGKYFLPELVNIWEFCEDPMLRKKMEMLLHLTWADWAVEALGGVRGGGKTRSYQGHYAWEDGWLVPADDLAPIVFVAGQRERFPAQDCFIVYVRRHSIKCTTEMVRYAFENSFGQTMTLTLYADGLKLPEVNGSRINLTPQEVYDSPYLKADHLGGLITIQKAPRKMTLDFDRNLIIEEDL